MNDFTEKLGLKVLNFASGKKITGCYAGDILSYALSKLKEGDIWVTSQKNVNVSAIAYRKKVACVILTDGIVPDTDMLEGAKKTGVNIFSTELGTYDIAVKISIVLCNCKNT